jgi:hypothetical protein
MSLTQTRISRSAFWNVNWGTNIKIRVGYFVGKQRYKWKKFIADCERLYGVFRDQQMASRKGRLDESEIEKVTGFQMDKVDKDFLQRATLEMEVPPNGDISKVPTYAKASHLCSKVLNDPSSQVKSVVNIGARVDVVCSYLASRHPGITFTSVDFQPDLAIHNSGLPQSPNWQFVSGYALNLLEAGLLAGKKDMALFSSTSVLFRNQELRDYILALAKNGTKYVVLNERWWPLRKGNPFHVPLPEEINPHKSYQAGECGNYLHNYPAILEEYGFTPVSSEIIGGAYYVYQMIARRTQQSP